jgi:hypothetical protein
MISAEHPKILKYIRCLRSTVNRHVINIKIIGWKSKE